MNKPELSIVIVSYNVRDMLVRCIGSIIAGIGDDLAYELIIADNCSKDGSYEMVRERFPFVKIIRNNYNAGFPTANNQGFAIAAGSYILMLNPDTEIINDAIQRLLTFYKRSKSPGVVGPKLLNADKSLQLSIWRFPKVSYILAEMLYMHFLIPGKYYKEKDYTASMEIDSMSGAAMLFSKEVLGKLKGLNEDLFWIEDVDFCYRAHQNGLHNYYYPDAEVVHYIGGSAKTNYNLSIYFQTVNKINFYKVHGSLVKVILLWVISFLNVIVRSIVFALLSPFRRLFYYKAKAYIYTLKRMLFD